MQITPTKMKWLLRFYPPYIGAGIKVESITDDWMTLTVSMKLRWYNKNAIGTHFGGSLIAMTDPHYVLLLMNVLGKKYTVWDKSATIEFIKPGRGKVSTEIKLSQIIIDEIIQHTKNGNKYLPKFELDIVDEKGEIVAKVQKTIYIREKTKK